MDLILLENIGDVNEDFPIHLVIVQHFKAILFVRRIRKKYFSYFAKFPQSCATHIFLSNLCPTHNSQSYKCPTLCIAMKA